MATPLERVRRPEYTGENRCWPCTVTNVVLLVAAVGVLALRGRRRTAVGVATAGVAGIGLRGYLVPYTPRLAPKLFARLPVDPFGHERGSTTGSLADATGSGVTDETAETRPASTASSTASTDTSSDPSDDTPPDGEVVLTTLLEAGVVDLEAEDVVLDPGFHEDWRREMASLRYLDLEALADVADEVTPPNVDTRTRQQWGRPVVILDPAEGAPVTLHQGVAIAELAAARALEERVDDAVARAAGRPLRSLLEECPLCGGEVTITRASCCGEATPVGKTPQEKLVCPSCNVRFFTYE
ncbi:hypothetical protein [Natronosalvus rutilus]|uniref:Uncharacterized protein n=1 Tax=Natronosalvus rutilus TaxID=2953753 RepID=A0A9E7N8B1_9EURY|nr:hypothetical protein [Natronosalvus rutilus]UTF52369.1 hypothetical protein NGM29_11260 [Natronosalvus rutilus]